MAGKSSCRQGTGPERLAGALAPPRDLLQLALDGPGAREDPPVQFVEIAVGCVKHEAAWHSNRDTDRAAIELDDKSLGNHWTPLPARRNPCDAVLRVTADLLAKFAWDTCACIPARRGSPEAPSAPPPAIGGALGALESCGAATWMQLASVQLVVRGHGLNMDWSGRQSRPLATRPQAPAVRG